MQAITLLSNYKSLPAQRSHDTVVSRILNWTKNEEKNRIIWVGISITAMAAVFFPITITVILLNGAMIPLIMGAMISLVAVVVTNLCRPADKIYHSCFYAGHSNRHHFDNSQFHFVMN